MVDVSKIHGPAGPAGAPEKKSQAAADAEKFHEAMQKRQVNPADPDEQKKRKQRGEQADEEEDLSAPLPTPATPASQVTPFSSAEEAGPLDLEGKGQGISPLQSAQRAAQPAPSGPSFYTSSQDAAVDSPEGWTPEGQQPVKAGPPAAATPMQPSQPPPGGRWAPEGQQPVKAGPPTASNTSKQPERQGQERTPQSEKGPPPDKRALAQGGTGVPIKMQPPGEKKPLAAPHEEGTQPAAKGEDATALFKRVEGGKEEKGEERAEEVAQQAEVGPAVTSAPLSPHVVSKEEDKEEELKIVAPAETAELSLTGGSGAPPMLMESAAPTSEVLPAYTHMHPEIQEMFDRMVGVMSVMTTSGMTETVLTLNTPQFGSSVFFGTQIIIQEFSTAPRAFNIQLNGTPQALALFQGNAEDLMAAFQSGNYNFRVNRLETGHLTDRPLFRRKGEASGKDQQQSNENSK